MDRVQRYLGLGAMHREMRDYRCIKLFVDSIMDPSVYYISRANFPDIYIYRNMQRDIVRLLLFLYTIASKSELLNTLI